MIPPRILPDSLPRAYGGCRCHCHRMPNVFHCIPCCYPDKDDIRRLWNQHLPVKVKRPDLSIEINYVEFDDAPLRRPNEPLPKKIKPPELGIEINYVEFDDAPGPLVR